MTKWTTHVEYSFLKPTVIVISKHVEREGFSKFRVLGNSWLIYGMLYSLCCVFNTYEEAYQGYNESLGHKYGFRVVE